MTVARGLQWSRFKIKSDIHRPTSFNKKSKRGQIFSLWNDAPTSGSSCDSNHCFQWTCSRRTLLHGVQCWLRCLPRISRCHSWSNRTSILVRLVLWCTSGMCGMLAGSRDMHGCVYAAIHHPDTVVQFPSSRVNEPFTPAFQRAERIDITLLTPHLYLESIILNKFRNFLCLIIYRGWCSFLLIKMS